VGGFTASEPGGRLRVGVVVEPGDPSVVFDSLAAELLDGTGAVAGRWLAKDASVLPVVGAIAAAPGTYRLRVVALDKSGRAGSAETEVEARLVQVGPLSLGSLLLGLSRANGFVPRLEFGSEPTAVASFDIYGGTGGERVTATLDVALTPGGPAVVSVPLTLTRASASRIVALGAVPVGALPPGDYVIRGTIGLDDGTTGRVIRTLRKVKQ